jgi:hypothetical protein
LAAVATATVSSSAASNVHPCPPEIATVAEGHPAAADVAAAEDGGGGGSGGNKSKKTARLFELDMSTRLKAHETQSDSSTC